MPAVLLVKTSSLGDVVHNLPVVSDIIRHMPGADIDWVVEEGIAALPGLHPGVRRVIPVAMRRWRRGVFAASTWREIAALVRSLRAQRYDYVIDTQGLIKSAVIATLAKGPTAGQDRHSAREPLAALFYTRAFRVPRDRHAVTRNRELAASAIGYHLDAGVLDYGLRAPVDPEALAALPDRYVMCLHGTARVAKRWPDEHWVELGRWLVARGLTPVFSWGSDQERAQAAAIAGSAPGVVVPRERLALSKLPSILAKADFVVGVDTGLVHLAVALDRPTVGIYVDSWPRLSGAFPGDPARAVNLGGVGQPPAVGEVTVALGRLGLR